MSECSETASIIGQAALSVIFIVSEIMPFIKSVKSNGLIHCLVNLLKSQKKEETPPLQENSDTDSPV